MKDLNKINLGLRIRQVRTSLHLTLGEFGNRLNKKAADSLVSRWERGINSPNIERLQNIAKLGNTSVNWLLTGIDDSPVNYSEKDLAGHTMGNDSKFNPSNAEVEIVGQSLHRIKYTRNYLIFWFLRLLDPISHQERITSVEGTFYLNETTMDYSEAPLTLKIPVTFIPSHQETPYLNAGIVPNKADLDTSSIIVAITEYDAKVNNELTNIYIQTGSIPEIIDQNNLLKEPYILRPYLFGSMINNFKIKDKQNKTHFERDIFTQLLKDGLAKIVNEQWAIFPHDTKNKILVQTQCSIIYDNSRKLTIKLDPNDLD